MISIAVCDDNMIFTEQLNSWIIEFCEADRITADTELYSSAEELLEDVKKGRDFELLFLDIEMKEMNGIELGLILRDNSCQALIVYVSGYDQYLRQLFEVEPFRFLPKPVEKAAFFEVMEKAADRIGKGHREIFRFQFGKNVISLLCRDIIYIESSQRKLTVHCTRGDYEYYHKLDDAQKELEQISSSFVRIHKAYLVNMDFVEAFQYDKLALRNGTILNISEKNRVKVRSLFWDYLKRQENG